MTAMLQPRYAAKVHEQARAPRRRYFFDREAETMPREQLERLQLKRLRASVKAAYGKVPLHRERMRALSGMELLVHVNREGADAGITPFTHGSSYYTDIMKTQGLRQALDAHGFDIVFGGARRDEEKSRAKERIFSFRAVGHRWDPKAQRPELWNLYNSRIREGESIRVFPLSNWTETDIWQYIYQEQIPIVPLYFAKPRPVVARGGTLILVDDDRIPLEAGEQPEMRLVRFRTLGCYPLTGAVESTAASVEEILAETPMVAEGVATTESAFQLAQQYEVEMPIVEQVYEILFKNKSPRQAVHDLMTRESKREI